MQEKLLRLEQIANSQIRDNDVRNLFYKIAREDIEKKLPFDLKKYWQFYPYLNELGKTQLECWKADETLRRFYGGFQAVRAAVKFKRLLKK
jgi:hypothetical protein